MFSVGDVSDIVRSAGFLLLLALAAQGLLELLKAIVSVRGDIVAAGALNAVRQAAREHEGDPDELSDAVRRLLIGMGLGGLRVRALRVDHLTPEQLKNVVETVHLAPKSLRDFEVERQRLSAIANRAQEIFAVAQGSFDEKYKRRLHMWMLVASAVVVLAVGADVFSLTKQARPQAMTMLFDSLTKDNQLLRLRLANTKGAITAFDSLVARGRASKASAARFDSLLGRKSTLEDSTVILNELLRVSDEHLASVSPDLRRSPWVWRSPQWWVGILASIILVSLGPRAYQAFGKKG